MASGRAPCHVGPQLPYGGGGGYMLGFTEDIDKARTALKDYKLEVVYNF